MNKMTLLLAISMPAMYAFDNEKFVMNKMETLQDLCHCGCLHKVIAFTTTLNCLREGAFTLEHDQKVNYGIVTYQQQRNSRSYPRYQIILRTFKKMEADGFEYSLGHLYDEKLPGWYDEFPDLFANSNLTIRFAIDFEKELLRDAMNNGQAKLAYDLPLYRTLARRCLSFKR